MVSNPIIDIDKQRPSSNRLNLIDSICQTLRPITQSTNSADPDASINTRYTITPKELTLVKQTHVDVNSFYCPYEHLPRSCLR